MLSMYMDQNKLAASLAALKTRPEAGFLRLPFEAEAWKKCQQDVKKYRNFKKFVVVGLGGSSLGAKMLAEVFRADHFIFVDNLDVEFLKHLFTQIQLRSTLFIFISKTGNTIETSAFLEILIPKLNKAKISIEKNIIVVTESRENNLFQFAKQFGVQSFDVPEDVGGRYSIFTSVGLVPAGLMGLNLSKLRAGALKAAADETEILRVASTILRSFEDEKWVTVMWGYSSTLNYFGRWWIQLWAESLAKLKTRHGLKAPRVSTPVYLQGVTDQHSVLQQIVEGAKDKFIIFLRSESCEANRFKLKNPRFSSTQILKNKSLGDLMKAEAEGTAMYLDQQKIPNLTIKVRQLDEKNLGYLIYLFEIVVSTIGEYLDINAFDQPGVEGGKAITKKLLNSGSTKATFELTI